MHENDQPGSLSYFYGRTKSGIALHTSLARQMPALILGQAGMGKTGLVISILRQLYDGNDARTLQVSFLDCDQQCAYLFEEQPQAAAIGETERACAEIVETFLRRMEKVPHPDQPYALLVIDGLVDLFRDERFLTQFTSILARCCQEEVRVRFGVLATSWDVPQEITALFRTTIQFATSIGLTQHPTHHHVNLPPQRRHFFVAGPEPILEVCETPFIHFPRREVRKLFWMHIDRERFREQWHESTHE
jgi:hypothetical protein